MAGGGSGPASAAGQDVDDLLQQCIAGAFPFGLAAVRTGSLPSSVLDAFRDLDSELSRVAEEIRKLPCERLRAEAYWANYSGLLARSITSENGRCRELAGQLAGPAADRVRSLRFAAAPEDQASVSLASEELLLIRGRAYLLGKHLSLARAAVAGEAPPPPDDSGSESSGDSEAEDSEAPGGDADDSERGAPVV